MMRRDLVAQPVERPRSRKERPGSPRQNFEQVMINPLRPNALQYAPSDNSANLRQGEMVDVKDTPYNQCEETCPVGIVP
jgi:hypothetical protein